MLRNQWMKLRQLWLACLIVQNFLKSVDPSTISRLIVSAFSWESILKTAVIDLENGFRKHLGGAIINRAFVGFLCNFDNQEI